MVKKPGGNKRFQQNRNYIRKNDKIRAREVRVIGPDGEMLGVMPPEEAVKIAKSHGLDLVEVAASARPPVCRILEFGKYKYELSKNKRNKEINEMLSKLEIGSEVIAASGIIGKVKAIKGEYISLEVSENVVFKLQRSAIANILPKGTIESIK